MGAGTKTSFNGEVMILELRNPEKKNPLSAGLLSNILEELSGAQKKGAKVAIIKGSGDSFSAGYNLDPTSRVDYASTNGIVDDVEQLQRLAELLKSIRRSSLPVITQIHGYCFAGGTDLMLASDIAVAAESAKIGVPNVRSLGISLFSTLWPLAIGPMRAKMMMFTGDWISGRQAEAWGMVALSVPEDDLDDTVMRLAERISLMPVELLKAVKLATNRAFDVMGLDQMVAAAVEIDAVAHFSAPVVEFWRTARQEGLRSALKHREAPFADDSLSRLLGKPRSLSD